MQVQGDQTPAEMRQWFRYYIQPDYERSNPGIQASIMKMVGCEEDEPYLNLVKKARQKRAPHPRYDSIPGILTGNGS